MLRISKNKGTKEARQQTEDARESNVPWLSSPPAFGTMTISRRGGSLDNTGGARQRCDERNE